MFMQLFLSHMSYFFPFCYAVPVYSMLSQLHPFNFDHPLATVSQNKEFPDDTTSQKEEKYFQIFRSYLSRRSRKSGKKNWKQGEDELLLSLNNLGVPWRQIARNIQNTNQKICQRRLNKLLELKNKWPAQLDSRIKYLAQTQNFCWEKVYNMLYCEGEEVFPRHSLKQIKQRYLLNLRPGILKQEWDIEQDIAVLKLVKQFGTHWRKMSENFAGRTELQLKNRYYGTLKPLQKKVLRKLNSKFKPK